MHVITLPAGVGEVDHGLHVTRQPQRRSLAPHTLTTLYLLLARQVL